MASKLKDVLQIAMKSRVPDVSEHRASQPPTVNSF